MDVRKGMPDRQLDRQEFERRYRERFYDPAFDELEPQIKEIVAVAWEAYSDSRKAPRTRRAGPGFVDPNYELSLDWLNTRDAIDKAQARHDDKSQKPTILIINGSSRTEHTCPGEMSKSWRLVELAKDAIEKQGGIAVEILDLSRAASEFGRNILPCKSCVSTAMPLCHWPCSCYPNHALAQVNDWMNDIYPLWVAAHGILVVTPVNWYQTPGPLKAMIDRLVCADGGNPDPSSTHGKRAAEAKAMELAGWSYPRHLAGRFFGAVVHGDTAGTETLRRILMDWADDMHLITAGSDAELDGYIGYYEPYATGHEALDQDTDFQTEVEHAALAIADAIRAQRDGQMITPKRRLEPRPK